MRILMLLEKAFPPDIRVENEIATLMAAGHEVHLLCTRDARDRAELPATIQGLRIHTVRRRADLHGWRRRIPNLPLLWFYDARWGGRIRELAKELGRFDVVHVHDLPLVRTGQRAAKRMRALVVADLHENYPMVMPLYTEGAKLTPVSRFLLDPQRWERYEEKSVSTCSAVIAVADAMKLRLSKVGVPSARITVVENFVDIERFLSYPLDAGMREELGDSYLITYAGGFLQNRGLDTTLQAMAKVVQVVPEATLVLVGDGKIRNELETLTRQLGLQQHVRFEGWVEFSRLPSYFAASDVCILPLIQSTHTDATTSHKLFQYMLMGKPVVASASGETGRMIQEADCGLLFPPGDSEALSDALIRLTDPELRERLGERGREAVLDRYNWSRSAARLLHVYEELDSARRASTLAKAQR